MIILLRVYKDERVIAAEAYDHTEKVPQPDVPAWARMRCFPTPLWRQREYALSQEFVHDKITATPIYLPDKE